MESHLTLIIQYILNDGMFRDDTLFHKFFDVVVALKSETYFDQHNESVYNALTDDHPEDACNPNKTQFCLRFQQLFAAPSQREAIIAALTQRKCCWGDASVRKYSFLLMDDFCSLSNLELLCDHVTDDSHFVSSTVLAIWVNLMKNGDETYSSYLFYRFNTALGSSDQRAVRQYIGLFQDIAMTLQQAGLFVEKGCFSKCNKLLATTKNSTIAKLGASLALKVISAVRENRGLRERIVEEFLANLRGILDNSIFTSVAVPAILSGEFSADATTDIKRIILSQACSSKSTEVQFISAVQPPENFVQNLLVLRHMNCTTFSPRLLISLIAELLTMVDMKKLTRDDKNRLMAHFMEIARCNQTSYLAYSKLFSLLSELYSICDESEPLLADICDLCDDKICHFNWEIRDSCVEFIGKIIVRTADANYGQSLFTKLHSALDDVNGFVRATALTQLREYFAARSHQLANPSSKERTHLEAVENKLHLLLTADADFNVRRSAVKLAAFVLTVEESALLLGAVFDAGDDADWEVKREVAAFCGARFRRTESEEKLSKLCLSQYGSTLYSLLSDCDLTVRQKAREEMTFIHGRLAAFSNGTETDISRFYQTISIALRQDLTEIDNQGAESIVEDLLCEIYNQTEAASDNKESGFVPSSLIDCY